MYIKVINTNSYQPNFLNKQKNIVFESTPLQKNAIKIGTQIGSGMLAASAFGILASQEKTTKKVEKIKENSTDENISFDYDYDEEAELLKEKQINEQYYKTLNSIDNKDVQEAAQIQVQKFIDLRAPSCVITNEKSLITDNLNKYKVLMEKINKIKNTNIKNSLLESANEIFKREDDTRFTAKITILLDLFERKTMSAQERFLKFLKLERPEIYQELLKKPEQIKSKRILEIKQELPKLNKVNHTIEQCQAAPCSLHSQLLYQIYLEDAVTSDNPKISDKIKELCYNIYEDFGVKVYLPANLKEAGVALKLVYQELTNYKMMAELEGEKLNLPLVLNFSRLQETYFEENSAGFYEGETNEIGIDGLTVKRVLWALRHELLHANTRNVSRYFPEDFKPWHYTNEFLAAGVKPNHVSYAFKDRWEFLAVAAEGDMKLYSSDFKKLLVKLGMPKFVLKMQNLGAHKNIIKDPYAALKKEMDIVLKYKKENCIQDDDDEEELDQITNDDAFLEWLFKEII